MEKHLNQEKKRKNEPTNKPSITITKKNLIYEKKLPIESESKKKIAIRRPHLGVGGGQ